MDAKRRILKRFESLLCRALFFILLVVLISTLSLLGTTAGPDALANDSTANQIGQGSVTGDGQHYLGLRPSLSAADAFPQIMMPYNFMGPLGSSADLSSQLPPVGNQGSQGSCVAWATSYYYKSWSEAREHAAWNLANPYYQFSPSFVYNQINGGGDNGSTFVDAFYLLESEGDVDISQMPYNQYDYLTQPSSANLEAARPYRIPDDWGYFWNQYTFGPYSPPNDIASIKTWLNGGRILVMATPIYNDFPSFRGNPAKTYYDYNGSAGFAGGHGVCICGYDDNINPSGSDADHKGGFKMVNSWGPGWNGSNGGYVYLSYDFVKRYVWEAWAMSDLSPDTPGISSLSSSAGNVGDTIHIYGNNFGTCRRSARVSFSGANATDVSFTNADIRAVVPAGVTTGPLTVYDWEGTASNSVQFTVQTGPFIVNASVSGGHGSVAEATQTVNYGGTATVHINADTGYHIDSITDNGANMPIANPYVINNVRAGHNVVVNFAADPAENIKSSFYFAEGCTRQGFDEWLCLMNPGDSPTTAHITYMFTDGTTKSQDIPIGATTRATVKVNDAVGPDKDVSVKVTSEAMIVAERPMYFNYKGAWTGGHNVMGSTLALSSFYFAEGYTGPGFEEWLCLMNPGDSPTTAHITYMFADGTTKSQDVAIGATTRTTVKVNDVVGEDKDVSAKISSDSPIVAERPMYFNYRGKWTGGHDVVGAGSPGRSFYFAEGYTGQGFEEWLCLMNPGDSPTTAHLTYMFGDGSNEKQDVRIEATSRATVKVNDVVGSDKNVSVNVEADSPIMAERPVYFNYAGAWTGGHDVVGAGSPGCSFYFAEGYTGPGFEEWLCLMNPGDSSTTAHLTYMFGDGSNKKQDVRIGATSQATVNVNAVVGRDKSVSVKIEADSPIVAERPIYFDYGGKWTGGHDVVGYMP